MGGGQRGEEHEDEVEGVSSEYEGGDLIMRDRLVNQIEELEEHIFH